MKKEILFSLFLANVIFLIAQEKKINYDFYGFVRSDFYYNSRLNKEGSDGLSVAYPLGENNDIYGNDLNAIPQSGMQSIGTRMGVDFSGSKMLGADATAKIECDFIGTTGYNTMIRIRHAYMDLNWKNAQILTGQTWHPMAGDVRPSQLNLNSGVPFQPFARSPQIKLAYKIKNLRLFAVASSQLQYTCDGPIGKSNTYMKNANIPDLYAGIQNKGENWTFGAGGEMKKIVPRTSAEVDSFTVKVDESLISYACNIYAKYEKSLLLVKTKLTYGQNMCDYGMISGYGISSLDTITGRQTYTSINTFSSWINIVYGKKWIVGVYAGYTKNLGSDASLFDDNGELTIYGNAVNGNEMIGSIYKISPQIIFNHSNFQAGIEYDYTVAEWGDVTPTDGVVRNTYNVLNHRILIALSYMF